jgi:MFS family permease
MPVSSMSTQPRRALALLAVANFSAIAALWFVRAVIAWQLWSHARQAMILSLMAAFELVPILLLSIWFGTVSQRLGPRRVVVGAQIASALVSAACAAALLTAAPAPATLLLLAGLGAATGTLHLTARLALVATMFERPVQARATGLTHLSAHLGLATGGGLAGLALANALSPLGLLVATAVQIASAVCYGAFPAVRSPPADAIRVGVSHCLRYVAATPTLTAALLVFGLATAGGRGIADLLPSYTTGELGAGGATYGALVAALGLGALVVAVFLAVTSSSRIGLLMPSGLGLAIVACLLLDRAEHPSLAVAGMMALGAGVALTSAMAQIALQIDTPINQLGGVLGLYALIWRAAPAVGVAAFATITDASSFVIALVTAAATFAVSGLIWYGVRTYRVPFPRR